MSDLTKAEIADLLAEHTTPSQTPCACPPCRVLRQLLATMERLARAEGLLAIVAPIFTKPVLRHVPGPGDDEFDSFIKNDMDAFNAQWTKAEKAVNDYLKEPTDGE